MAFIEPSLSTEPFLDAGQLPYLSHGLHNANTFPSIVKYVAQLPEARDPNESLSALEKAQYAARVAHVESEYGDLVVRFYFALVVVRCCLLRVSRRRICYTH